MLRYLKGRSSFKQNFNFSKVLLLVMLFALFGMVANMDEVNASEGKVIWSRNFSFSPNVKSYTMSLEYKEASNSILAYFDYSNSKGYLDWVTYTIHNPAIGDVYTFQYSDHVGSQLTRSMEYIGKYTEVEYKQEYTKHSTSTGTLILYKWSPNTAPTTPSNIMVPSLKSGASSTISWGSSSDDDGDSITYRLERQVNDGSWTQVYSGSSRSYTETSLSSWNTVAYRVRAYDGTDYSSYRTSSPITVIHNTNPTLSITNPSANSYFGKETTISLSGKVNDPDSGQNVTISATVGGIKKSTTITTPSNNKPWTLSWSSNDLNDGVYSNITVTADDGNGGIDTKVFTKSIIVDKTPPKAPNINANEDWSKVNVPVSITHGADANVDRTEYSLNEAAWTTYTTGFTISNEGVTTIKARTIDKAGNVSDEATKAIKIDKTLPIISIADNDDDWHKENISVNVTHSDSGGSEVKTKQYAITNSTTEPSSGWVDLVSNNQNIDISNDGNNYVHVKVVDNAGNETYKHKGPFKIDKTAPIVNAPTLIVKGTNVIHVETHASDNLSRLHDTPYLFNRDGLDITSWISDNPYKDTGLDPNKGYAYMYKAKDNLENISDYSDPVSRYTKALYPEKVAFVNSSTNSIELKIHNDGNNANDPENQIILKEAGTENTVKSSSWSKDENVTISGLTEGKEYDVYINTKNGDGKIINGEIKANLVDSNGKPIPSVATVIPVKNFNISNTSVSTITVTWDTETNQEYQVWLIDENNNEVAGSRNSSWIESNTLEFKGLGLNPNTKYIPHITTRRINTNNPLPDIAVSNQNKAFTNAEDLTKATFESGEDFIKITLDKTNSKNPSYTRYMIKNNVTGQEETIYHNNPEWLNSNLARESYFSYSIKVIHENGEPSNYANLLFINGEPHTIIPDLNIDPDKITPITGGYIDLDKLKEHDIERPIWFNPEELNNKLVKHNDEILRTTKDKRVYIENVEEIDVINYSFSNDGFGYTVWKPLENGIFKESIDFNLPGIYKTHWIFKNYVVESDPILVNYLADWIKPTIIGEPSIKGQTAVTGDSFSVDITVDDNVSPYLFYSTDGGTTWYLLSEGQNQVVFKDINKSVDGIQNKLTVKVSDVCGNVSEKSFTVWGISK